MQARQSWPQPKNTISSSDEADGSSGFGLPDFFFGIKNLVFKEPFQHPERTFQFIGP